MKMSSGVITMNDGQKQTINHVYHMLRDMLDGNNGWYSFNLDKATQIKHMLWYLETNFPKDMLKHEMGDRGFLYEDEDEDEEQLSSFDGLLDPVEGDEDDS